MSCLLLFGKDHFPVACAACTMLSAARHAEACTQLRLGSLTSASAFCGALTSTLHGGSTRAGVCGNGVVARHRQGYCAGAGCLRRAGGPLPQLPRFASLLRPTPGSRTVCCAPLHTVNAVRVASTNGPAALDVTGQTEVMLSPCWLCSRLTCMASHPQLVYSLTRLCLQGWHSQRLRLQHAAHSLLGAPRDILKQASRPNFTHPQPNVPPLQVVVNYASSSGAAEAVAAEIKSLGGDAIIVGANSGNRDDMERCALAATMQGMPVSGLQTWPGLDRTAETPSLDPPARWVEKQDDEGHRLPC